MPDPRAELRLSDKTDGARETLRLKVTLTGVRGSDNALQGRHASVAFDWTATQA